MNGTALVHFQSVFSCFRQQDTDVMSDLRMFGSFECQTDCQFRVTGTEMDNALSHTATGAIDTDRNRVAHGRLRNEVDSKVILRRKPCRNRAGTGCRKLYGCDYPGNGLHYQDVSWVR